MENTHKANRAFCIVGRTACARIAADIVPDKADGCGPFRMCLNTDDRRLPMPFRICVGRA